MIQARAIAFYLPQYHPVPENDQWWGKGFTEWTNVTKSRPLFPNHYQPQLPADLGYYDLRVAETREAQAALAQRYGIHGFCYYHYWFNGRRILERPFNEVLASGSPDFPFCLCWANENWTRLWDGLEREVLLRQVYSPDDDYRHLESLIPAFRDDRYIKIGGKPLFLVYRFSHLPEPNETIRRWRETILKAGFPGLYLVNVESSTSEHALAEQLDLDAAVEFAPDWTCLPPPLRPTSRRPPFFRKWPIEEPWCTNHICRYVDLANRMRQKPPVNYTRFRGVTPSWDNSARRRGGATILIDSTPELYRSWLAEVVQNFQPPSPDENFIFLNAWNEWAEGNYLEPCQRWGHAYLEATQSAVLAQRENEAPAEPTYKSPLVF